MKAIITVLGKDKVGILAGVSTLCADYQVNILDVSQTVMQDYFSMIMLVDIEKMTVPLPEFIKLLDEKGNQIGVKIQLQKEEIFKMMHHV